MKRTIIISLLAVVLPAQAQRYNVYSAPSIGNTRSYDVFDNQTRSYKRLDVRPNSYGGSELNVIDYGRNITEQNSYRIDTRDPFNIFGDDF